MYKAKMCFQKNDGELLFPDQICKPFEIYRDNYEWGTYYFKRKIDPAKEKTLIIYKFSIVEHKDNLLFDIIQEVITNSSEIVQLNIQFKENNIRFQPITIEWIGEPYQCQLSNMVLSLNQK